jgi:hypothetical protein
MRCNKRASRELPNQKNLSFLPMNTEGNEVLDSSLPLLASVSVFRTALSFMSEHAIRLRCGALD